MPPPVAGTKWPVCSAADSEESGTFSRLHLFLAQQCLGIDVCADCPASPASVSYYCRCENSREHGARNKTHSSAPSSEVRWRIKLSPPLVPSRGSRAEHLLSSSRFQGRLAPRLAAPCFPSSVSRVGAPSDLCPPPLLLTHSKAAMPNLFGTRALFRGRRFFHRLEWEGWFADASSASHVVIVIISTCSHSPELASPAQLRL